METQQRVRVRSEGESRVSQLAVAPATHGVLAAKLFGPLDVAVDGRRVELEATRSGEVLAFLLLHKQAASIDRIVSALWPERLECRNALNLAVRRLRRVVGEATRGAIIVRRGDSLAVAPSVGLWTDVDEFVTCTTRARAARRSGDAATMRAAYEQAVRLADGLLLEDLPYAEWALPYRERLRTEAILARVELGNTYLASGNLHAAISHGQQARCDDRFDQSVVDLLLRAWLAAGQPHRALQLYEDYSRDLRREIGIGPSESLRLIMNEVKLV